MKRTRIQTLAGNSGCAARSQRLGFQSIHWSAWEGSLPPFKDRARISVKRAKKGWFFWLAYQLTELGAIPAAGFPIHPLVRLGGKFAPIQRPGSNICQTRQEGMVLLVGIPTHREDSEVPVPHDHRPVW